MPEIEIKIKVNICSRCYHLWERRKGIGDGKNNQPMVCPNCNSPYWDSMPRRTRGKIRKEPLMFHGEKVLDSNFDSVTT